MQATHSPSAHPSNQPHCLLIGEALADLFPQRMVLGGAPFNVARNLAALGQPAMLITRMGVDELADRMLQQFAHFGLPTLGVQRDTKRPTGVVRVHMSGRDHRFEIGHDQAWDAMDSLEAQNAAVQWRPDVVYFGTLAQRSAASRAAVRSVLAATPALRFVDLNLRDVPDNEALAHDGLQLAHIAKMNEEELQCVLRWFVHPGHERAPWGTAEHAAAVVELVTRFSLQQLIVTRGSAGYVAFGADGSCLTQGASPSISIKDTVGAGDAFTSIALLGQMHGWPLDLTLRRASEFAAAVCTLHGAVTHDLRFYRDWQQHWQREGTHGLP